jgi:hypothetical protein
MQVVDRSIVEEARYTFHGIAAFEQLLSGIVEHLQFTDSLTGRLQWNSSRPPKDPGRSFHVPAAGEKFSCATFAAFLAKS